MDNINLLPTLPLLGLYAETHFRFGGWTPSMLFKREPEIIFDMPRRISKNFDIPLFLFLNDVDRFPVEIKSIKVALSQNKKSNIIFECSDIFPYEIQHSFSKRAPSFLFEIPNNKFDKGNFYLTCKAVVKVGTKEKIIINDNLPTSSKQSLRGYITNTPLPGSNDCYYGDMHVHSQFTESHVEFCPPISAIQIAAKSWGADFINITDHSYDLACSTENYLKPDPNLKRWELSKKEIKKLNNENDPLLIQGEEVSVLNSKKKVVHLGACGIKSFVEGTADGARKNCFDKSTNNSVTTTLQKISLNNGISFAAHPGARAGLLSKILLKRGIWNHKDIPTNLDAFQAVNDEFSTDWYNARKLWIVALLDKKQLPLVAGNDSHGDFNRYRAISIPFLAISDLDKRYFGKVRTGILVDKASGKLSEALILSKIKAGQTFITTGPFINLLSNSEDTLLGKTFKVDEIPQFTINAKSTSEFGYIENIKLFLGNYSTQKEELFKTIRVEKEFEILEKIDIKKIINSGYIRVEVICEFLDNKTFTMAASSPVYLKI